MGNGRRVLVVVAVATAVRIGLDAGTLPERMATHFDAAGRPNGWMPREGFLTVEIGLVGFLAVLFLALPAILRRVPPGLVSWPNAAYWLAPERRDDALPRIGDRLAWLGVATVALVAYANELVIDANLRRGPLDSPSLGMGIAAYLLAMGTWMIAIRRGFRVPVDASASGSGSRA